MHQNSFIADKVGVKICNFKVIDKNCFIKFLNLRTSYICNSTIKKIYFVTFNKVSGGYPASVNNIEGVVDIMIIASFLKNVNEKESRGFEIIDTSALLILLQLSIVHLSFFEIFSSFNNFRICRKYGD